MYKKTAVLAGEMETLGLPSPCTKVNMYKKAAVLAGEIEYY